MAVAAAEAAGAATLPALGAAAITTLGAAAAGRGVAEQSHRERLKQLRTEVTALQELQQQVSRLGFGSAGLQPTVMPGMPPIDARLRQLASACTAGAPRLQPVAQTRAGLAPPYL